MIYYKMGASMSNENRQETLMERREALLEGKLVSKNGRSLLDTYVLNKQVDKKQSIKKIIRNFVRKKVENEFLNEKLKENKSLFNHHEKVSSVYNFNSKNKNYIVKLDVSLYHKELERQLEMTKYVVDKTKSITPKIQKEKCDVLELEFDQETTDKIIDEIKKVENNIGKNLKYLYDVFEPGTSIYVLVLVTEKLDKTLEDYLAEKERSDNELNTLQKKLKNILEELHSYSVCHNDIHDQNFMIKDKKWYIIDFGESKYTNDDKGRCWDYRMLDNIFDTYKRNRNKKPIKNTLKRK